MATKFIAKVRPEDLKIPNSYGTQVFLQFGPGVLSLMWMTEHSAPKPLTPPS